MDSIEEPLIQETTMEEPMEGETADFQHHFPENRDRDFHENGEEAVVEDMEDMDEMTDFQPEELEEIIPSEIFLAPAAEDSGDKLLDNMAVEPEPRQPVGETFSMPSEELPSGSHQQEAHPPVQQRAQPNFAHLSFEEASGKLRDIIGRLERGNTSLEESLSLYQEGKQLISYCQGKISNVKEQVLILKPQGAGGPPLEETFTREKRL